jgi:tripartite-type tricarboxylate transporter receptor subunit TctC
MMHGRKPSGVEYDAYLAFFGSGFAAQKPAMLPRGTAPEIVAAYRRAFAEAVADPDLQAKKGEVLGDYEQAVGDNIQRLYEVATTIAPEARAWVRELPRHQPQHALLTIRPPASRRPLPRGGSAMIRGRRALLARRAPRAGRRARAQASFAGRTIEFVIPFAEAGGSDVWARFFAPFVSRHLPGQPTVIVRNVPGGGSITGANDWAQRARPDGSSFFGPSASTQLPFLLGDRRVRYDYAKWTPLIVSPTGGVVYVSSRTGITRGDQIAELRGKELVFPSQGATGLDIVPILALHLLGLNTRYVFGMRGRGDARLAVERGDANADHQTTPAWLTQVVPMVRAGAAVPLFSYGVPDAQGNIQRDPSFPEIPTFEEVYRTCMAARRTGRAMPPIAPARSPPSPGRSRPCCRTRRRRRSSPPSARPSRMR